MSTEANAKVFLGESTITHNSAASLESFWSPRVVCCFVHIFSLTICHPTSEAMEHEVVATGEFDGVNQMVLTDVDGSLLGTESRDASVWGLFCRQSYIQSLLCFSKLRDCSSL